MIGRSIGEYEGLPQARVSEDTTASHRPEYRKIREPVPVRLCPVRGTLPVAGAHLSVTIQCGTISRDSLLWSKVSKDAWRYAWSAQVRSRPVTSGFGRQCLYRHLKSQEAVLHGCQQSSSDQAAISPDWSSRSVVDQRSCIRMYPRRGSIGRNYTVKFPEFKTPTPQILSKGRI